MGVARLQDALERLTAVIRDVERELAAMKAEHDPLASHIFISRRHYRNANDTKGGKRRETFKPTDSAAQREQIHADIIIFPLAAICKLCPRQVDYPDY